MPRTRRPETVLLLALAAALLASCGYSTRRLTIAPNARTIAVLPFTSPGFRRDLDLRLTQAVVREIRARTSLAIGSPSSADLVLSGEVEADTPVVLQGLDREVIQQRVQGKAMVVLRERASGRILKSWPVYGTTEFGPGRRGESLEGSATDEWVRRMAVRIVEGLEQGL